MHTLHINSNLKKKKTLIFLLCASCNSEINAANELEFSFDVKTTLNISDVTFYESQTMNGYDLYASASDKEDILYLNLFSGKYVIMA